MRASDTIISLVSVYLMNTTSVYPGQVGSDRVFSFGYVERPGSPSPTRLDSFNLELGAGARNLR